MGTRVRINSGEKIELGLRHSVTLKVWKKYRTRWLNVEGNEETRWYRLESESVWVYVRTVDATLPAVTDSACRS